MRCPSHHLSELLAKSVIFGPWAKLDASEGRVHVCCPFCLCSHPKSKITVKMLALLVTAFYVIISAGIFNDDYPPDNILSGNQESRKSSGTATVSSNSLSNVC